MRRIAIGAALAIALTAAGCGGGGGGKTLSKAAYGRELNAICVDLNAKVKKIGQPRSVGVLASKGSQITDVFSAAIAQAAKLRPPKELQADASTFVSDSKQLRGLLGKLVAAAKKNDVPKLAQLGAQAVALGRETQSLGKKLGAPSCSSLLG